MLGKSNDNSVNMKIIARIYTEFPEKFGVPRQSGLAEGLCAKIVFEPEYRSEQAVRGLCEFSHIWLLWHFSESEREGWSPTVRPPRLGGNRRVGVFATRSPFRPNAIGLSSVRLLKTEQTKDFGPVLYVSGADMVSGTPIFDIKPYLPFTDSHPDASCGFAGGVKDYALKVEFPDGYMSLVPPDKREALVCVLSQDPRPSYQDDEDRVYGFGFCGLEIKFKVKGDTLTVCGIEKSNERSDNY